MLLQVNYLIFVFCFMLVIHVLCVVTCQLISYCMLLHVSYNMLLHVNYSCIVCYYMLIIHVL